MTEQTCNKEILKKMKDISIIGRANSFENFTPYRYGEILKILYVFCFLLYLLILVAGGYLTFLFLDANISEIPIAIFLLANIFAIGLWIYIFSLWNDFVFSKLESYINKKIETIETKKRNDYHLFLEKKYNEIDKLLIAYKPNNYNNFKKLQENIKRNGFKFEFILEFIDEEENSQDQEKLKETFKFLSKEE
ncbi:hypothetical protein [Xenorhabdus bovienii]|uniref:hypothetical protein n=1 Tax=Xenorhabdus bovienii TaxID=40576 RepID=UPI0023B214FA|nr:hypothetical protein [Xenorhabdus bovienii]MDE9544167.1 hypothetical protein [Xenorhabdus bovienii]